MSEIILHHYDASPFTQRVLRMLGLKGLEWRSVETPMILPKPDLVCLTGGYRGTPVMQIGADIYIDTQCIARELERRFPAPSFFPGGDTGLGCALAQWADQFFESGLIMALAILGPEWEQSFMDDRKAIFTGIDFASLDQDVAHAMARFRANAALLDEQLSDGRAFLTGEAPALADLQAFGVPWFTRAAIPATERLLVQFSRLPAWEHRVAQIGEGTRRVIPVEQAHAEARAAEPDNSAYLDPDDPQELQVGIQVQIESDDFSRRGAVIGSILRVSALEFAILRHTDEFGDLVIHFPRLGYRISTTE